MDSSAISCVWCGPGESDWVVAIFEADGVVELVVVCLGDVGVVRGTLAGVAVALDFVLLSIG